MRRKKKVDEDFFLSFDSIQGENKEQNKEQTYFSVIANYIKYYRQRAHKCKMQFYTLSTIKFLSISLIPVLENINTNIELSWSVSAASAVCLLMEAIIGLMHLRSKWALYRSTYNELLGVQRRYGIHRSCGVCTSAFEEYVSQAEDIIQKEACAWEKTVRKKDLDDKE